MRLIVFFDLPVGTKAQRRAAAQFRHFLLRDGYTMLQWSVYGRLIAGWGGETKHLMRLKAHLPSEGSIRALVITERQYTGMHYLLGEPSFQEKRLNADQLLLF
jgi:CRISPR-associated protein Cas2